MPRTSTPSPADLPSPSARHLPRVRRGDGWDALADIEVFVFAVEAELEAMVARWIGVHRRADSDDVARSFRDHVARCSDMMSPA